MITSNEEVFKKVDNAIEIMKELQESFLYLSFWDMDSLLSIIKRLQEFKTRELFNTTKEQRAYLFYINYMNFCVYRNNLYIIRTIDKKNMDTSLPLSKLLKTYPNFWIKVGGKIDKKSDDMVKLIIQCIIDTPGLYNQLIEDEATCNKDRLEIFELETT